MEPLQEALLTDLYQLTMVQAYLESGQIDTAVFEFFVRKLPPQRGFLMAAGLDQALDFLENLRFSTSELNWLEKTGRFNARLIDYLANFRFGGEVHGCRKAPCSIETSRFFG
jgi:nicotinate phosphoribosyltransferase